MRKGDNYLKKCVKEWLYEQQGRFANENKFYETGFKDGVKEFVYFWFEVNIDDESEDD